MLPRKDKGRASKEIFFLMEDAFKMKAGIKFQLMAMKLLLIILWCIVDMRADQKKDVVNLLTASAYSG